MASSYEKSVKGGTKIKVVERASFEARRLNCPQLAAPKSKYVEHILQATNAGEAGVAEVFRTMQHRLRDSTWTIVFKGLIMTHLMIREGQPDTTLRYLSEEPTKLAISNFSDGMSSQASILEVRRFDLPRSRQSGGKNTSLTRWSLQSKFRARIFVITTTT